MGQQRILVIEDDQAIRRGITDMLRYNGYAVDEAARGNEGLHKALGTQYDLLLLDLVLPELDGLDILRALRAARPAQPVIILTARGSEPERVKGLLTGADDYVVKPFSIRELLARVEAVLRRSPQRPEPVNELAVPGGRLDMARNSILFDDGSETSLTVTESALLKYMVNTAGNVVSREELLARVWKMNPKRIMTRTVDMTMARLREKIRDNGAFNIIRTIRGKGYQFRFPASKDGSVNDS
jgi:two-component system, OmpR family, alkaline phosphatase synthesis response regulator PhoP